MPDIEDKLNKDERLYSQMVNEVEEYAIMLLDKEGNVLSWNKGAEKITGYKRKETLGKNFRIFYTSEDQQVKLPEALLDMAKMNGKAINESWCCRKDGSMFRSSTSITTLYDNNNHIIGFSSITRDLTERFEAEEKLKKSERLLHSILLNIPGSLIMIVDRNHKVIMAEGDIKEKSMLAKPGFSENLSLEMLKDAYSFATPFYENALSGDRFSIERSTKYANLLIHFVPLRDSSDNVEYALIVALDITKIKEAEKRILKLNHMLEKKVKKKTAQYEEINKELEAFAYSVSHDLRAPLRSINGYSRIILEDYAHKLDDYGQNVIQSIIRNVGKMGDLIEDLLAFSRLGKKSLQITVVNMNDIVRSILDDNYDLGETGTIKFNIKDLLPVSGDQTLLKQVWVNLISNAVKYSGTKPIAEVEIGSSENGNCTTYYVRDNGVGFDMQYYDKLFGVFQRLHGQKEFEGTGVGLAIVQKIIKHHGGKIWAEGKVGQGAIFYFSLPKFNENL